MIKLFIQLLLAFVILMPMPVLAAPADAVNQVIGTVDPPEAIAGIEPGNDGLNQLINNVLSVVFGVVGLIVLFQIIMAAYGYITSGGNKESIAAAQKRILYAIIGLVLLAFSYIIVSLLGNILGFNLINFTTAS